MNTKFLLLSILAVLISFAGGFMIANSLNRSEITRLQAENEQFKNQTQGPKNQEETTLSDEEIKQRIAEADKNPQNFEYQKNLGLALYRYAAMKQDAELMSEVSRLLNRAIELQPNDYDVTVALGNVYFDIGYFKKENDKFEKAREFYLKALAEKPEDVDVRTDYGLTFYLTDPPDLEKAIKELEKSVEVNPKHEKTLQVLVEAYLKQGKTEEAEKTLTKLEEANPNNSTIGVLKTKIGQAKTGTGQ